MKRTLPLATLAAALALTASTWSIAQQPPSATPAPGVQHGHHGAHHNAGAHPHHGAGHGARHGSDGLKMPGAGFLRGLDLSEAQRDRVFSILHAQAPTLREKAREARTAREAMHQLALAGELDETRLQEAAQRASRAMTDLAVQRARTHNAVFKELTPEQQSQLKARREHRGHSGHSDRHGRADLSDSLQAG